MSAQLAGVCGRFVMVLMLVMSCGCFFGEPQEEQAPGGDADMVGWDLGEGVGVPQDMGRDEGTEPEPDDMGTEPEPDDMGSVHTPIDLPDPPFVRIEAEGRRAGCTQTMREGYDVVFITIPLVTVRLRGVIEEVMEPARTHVYTWAIEQMPHQSTARLTPNTSASDVSLFLDLAGDYVVSLTVEDGSGQKSRQARVLIRALPCGL